MKNGKLFKTLSLIIEYGLGMIIFLIDFIEIGRAFYLFCCC